MREDDLKDLEAFLGELQRESDRGLALVGAALIDEKLLQTLEAFFCESEVTDKLLQHGTSPLGTFSARIDACIALGLIDDVEYREITLVRKVRNEFAHSTHGTNFKAAKITGYCSSFASDLPEGAGHPTNNPRFRFTNAVVALVTRLYYRPDWVKKEKRHPKIWIKPEQVRWRAVDEEPPPDGEPVLVMAKKDTERRS